MSTSDDERWRLVERVERDAWIDMYRAPDREYAQKHGLIERTVGAGVVQLSFRSVDIPQFDRAFGFGVDGPPTMADVDAILAAYAEQGIRGHYLQVAPPVLDEVAPMMAAGGLVARTRWVKVLRDARPTTAGRCDFRIDEVHAGDARFGATVCAGFGMPPFLTPWLQSLVGRAGWRCYVAMDGDAPVAAGAVFVAGRNAWLGLGATVKTHRNRGAQSALMVRRINDARAAGCEHFVTETGEDTPASPNPSLRNMFRAGFETVHLRQNFGLPPQAP